MDNTHPTTINLVLDRQTATDVLRAVLHSILFHRLFGTIKPQTFEVLDVTMFLQPGVADPEMERLVNENVDSFWKAIEGGESKRGQIIVTLSEKKSRKSWFQVYDEDVPWEQWTVNAEIRQPKSERDRQAFDAALAAALTQSLRNMLAHTSSARGRAVVPLITDASRISPFPIKVEVKVGRADGTVG